MNLNRRLIAFVRNSRAAFGLAVLAGALGGILTIVQAQNLSLVVSQVFLGDATLYSLQELLLTLGTIITGRALLAWVGEVSAQRVAGRVRSSLRQLLIAHIVKLGPSYLSAERTGELTVAAVESLDALDAYFYQYLPQLVLAAIIPFSILVFVLPLDPLSGLILLLTAPLIPIFMILIGRVGEALTGRQYDLLTRLSAHFLDSLQGLTTLKVFGQSKAHARTIAEVSDEFARTTLRVLRVTFLSALVLEMVATLSTAVIAVEIGLRLLYYHLEFEQAFFLLVLAPEFYLPLRMLGTRFHSGMSGTTAAKKIFSILDIPLDTAVEEPGSYPPGALAIDRISFCDVDFRYPDENKYALRGINLKIHAGQQIALVGRSGAGKSTLLDLLLRFIRPTGGQILVDDRPLSSIPEQIWRNQLAWVPQDPFILNASIAENIRLGCPQADIKAIEEAAKAAHLDAFIATLPDRYETSVGEGGARLSSGQLRRLALARAFLKDAPILILDEPVSDLDPLIEAELEQSTRELTKDRTAITIAHRLNTIRRADQIAVLESGRIIECGTHEELLANADMYAHMMRAQDPSSRIETPRLPFPEQRPEPEPASPSIKYSERDRPFLSIGLRLISFLQGSWSRVIFSMLLGTATIFSSIGLLGTSSWLISAAALHPSIADLQVAIVGVRFFGLSRGIFRYLERLTSHDVTFRLLSRLRSWFYAAVEPLAPARLMQYRSGDILSRIVADVDTLEDFYIRIVSPIMIAFIVSVGSAAYLGQFTPVGGWILLIFLFVQGAVIPLLIGRISRNPGYALVTYRAALHAQLVETVQGLADLSAFGRVSDRQADIERSGGHYDHSQQRMALITGLHRGLAIAITNFGMLSVLIVGISAVNSGKIPGVMLAALTMMAMASFEAVLPLPQAAQLLGKILKAARRLLMIVDIEPEVVVRGVARLRDGQSTAIEISDMSFTYPGSRFFALENIDLHLPQGGMLAVVGPSGAGKSTLIHLLLRFWEFQQGAITVGGRSVRDYDPDELRQLFAVMPQRPYFFYASVRSNLLLARPDATEPEMILATQQAQIHEFITQLPEGYETVLGEQGLRLSGGERQRLAIARALLRDAPVMIFDEPTANLDPITEGQLFKSIYALMRAKTDEGQHRSSILITHRLIGLEHVDQVVVLEQGRIVEQGKHADLLQSQGLYQHLHALQQRMMV